VPVWHEATKAFREDGRIRMVGIIQEQHPDRARLFMQWKQMDWPIMVDSFNELDVAVVPITIFIDEHGVIRNMKPPRRNISASVEKFVNTTFDPVPMPAIARVTPAGIEAAYWGGERGLDQSISLLRRPIVNPPVEGRAYFRIGVASRRRHDSPRREPGDFPAAVLAWQKALDKNPNQYIWRRRIQQYGPRLDKPYPFYDWVTKARAEITARGEQPWPLPVQPSGAEIARPLREFRSAAEMPEPDPKNRITLDKQYVAAETTVVPATVAPGGSVRVHIHLRPIARTEAHWNNEAEDLLVWMDPGPGWEIDARKRTWPRPPAAVSRELRTVEFEVKVPVDAEPGERKIPAYALVNVCEGVDGTCLYRRKDLPVTVTVKP